MAHCTDEGTEARARRGAARLARPRPPTSGFYIWSLAYLASRSFTLLYTHTHTHPLSSFCASNSASQESVPVLLEPTRPSPGLTRPLDSHNKLLQLGLLTPPPPSISEGENQSGKCLAQGLWQAARHQRGASAGTKFW